MKTLTLALILVVLMPLFSYAGGTNCTTRKSGSVTVTSCSNAYGPGGHTQCRSYRSGSVIKTSCR
jgi:hypothetical protein